MTILVTGAFGLLGCALQKVVAQDTTINPKEYFFLARSECDLRDRNQVLKLFERVKPNVVIHLASHVGGVYDNMSNNLKYLLENSDINNNIVYACSKFEVSKLINILSTCIFPDYPRVQFPLTSEQLHNGLPHFSNIGYAYSKRLLHVASNILADTTRTQVINLIPTNLYGENDNYNIISGHVIPALIHKTYLARQTNGTLYIKGSGKAQRQFVHATDLAQVILHFVTTNVGEKQISCVISPPESESVSIKQVVDYIVKAMNFTGPIHYDGNSCDGQLNKTASHHELTKYLPDFNFTSLEQGLQKTCQFFVENHDLLRK